MEFPTRSAALRELIRRTGGKRDALTNWFRSNVAPRKLVLDRKTGRLKGLVASQ